MSNFIPDTLKFLVDLRCNNGKAWFDANRERYETSVRGPALTFIEAMELPMVAISDSFLVSARKVGGSLMRIHRDTRFSKDKSPYKTNIGIQFRHTAGKDVHAPGFYLHIEPGEVFLGVGSWRPAGPSLAKIREAISDKPDEWLAARDDSGFRALFEPSGDSLKNPPRGYTRGHPMLSDLKRKDFIAMCPLAESNILEAGFPEQVSDAFSAAVPYMRFLCRAIGVSF